MKQILIKPVITEKSMVDAGRGKYTFCVNLQSTKNEIVQEVEESFKVKVLSVKTIVVKGKIKQVGSKRKKITTSSWKKAIVELASGQKIDLFEVTGEQK
ncbi:50S ribosomal protein L23 [Candidatus Microgenomates bacterium]|nr:50S ribosomal protein L23 [Candidatus Microgenomates bacterium]